MEAFLSGKPLSPREVALGLRALSDKIFKADRPSNVNELWKEHLIIRHILGIATKEQKKFGVEELLDQPRTDEDLETFLKWSETQGIRHDPVDVVRSPGGDGFCLRANRPIKEGETLVEVPREAMITSETARQSNQLKMIFDRSDMEMYQKDSVILSVFLLCQKFSRSSKREPYIKMLPSKFDLPIFYSVEQLEYLKPSPVFESTLCLYRKLTRQFCRIFEDVFELHEYNEIKKKKKTKKAPVLLKTPLTMYNFNFDTFRWAVGCVMTRMNVIKDSGISAFIPLMDFANHEFIPELVVEASVDNDKKKHKTYARITAHRDFEVGEMYLIFDIPCSNWSHLLRNGRVPEKNPHDRYSLTLPIPRSDKHYEEKTQFFESLGFRGEDAYTFVLDVDDILIPRGLLSLAKIIVSRDAHIDDYDTLEIMLKALKYLKNRFMLLRRTYKITEGTNDFERKIERLHRSEVDILQKAEEFCAKWERELLGEDEPSAAVDAVAPALKAGASDSSEADAAATKTSEAPSK